MKNQTEKTQIPLSEMTLRDFFAAQAMQAYCSSPEWREDTDIDQTANAAYWMADEMMKARK